MILSLWLLLDLFVCCFSFYLIAFVWKETSKQLDGLDKVES